MKEFTIMMKMQANSMKECIDRLSREFTEFEIIISSVQETRNI